tara:strand:- start:685 stop:1830 length:1146 start_codon:yes stop_codon:yes gene_type:complete
MLGIFRRKKTPTPANSAVPAESESVQNSPKLPQEERAQPSNIEVNTLEVEAKNKPSLFQRFKQGLHKTRQNFGDGLANLILGKKKIDAELLEDIETQLLLADVGVDATNRISHALTQAVKRNELTDGNALMQALKAQLHDMLTPLEQPLVSQLHESENTPYVILMVGVNGAGKTTTIGKLAKQLSLEGKKVMLAAGDTFRAAAVEQLQVWGERNQIPVIAQHTGADSASVIFDAFNAAKARGMDVLIADTAGRLHTQHGLMEELKKVKRVIQKLDEKAPHEVMLVLDASIGQNALTQATQFHDAVGVTGITMTKLDGTAKGGILFAVAERLSIPFRYIGIGEDISDLRAFEATAFVDALFDEERLLEGENKAIKQEALEEA